MQQQVSAAMNSYMTRLAGNMSSAMGIDQSAFADAFQMNMDENELAELMASLMSTEQSSYDNNMKKLGWADYAKPASIDIYPKDFPSKQNVIDILDNYNDRMESNGEEGKVVSYTDIVGALMSSVTTIVNMISYVLVAFVAISLVVSSIMIGVITYISVLERKKEIGILRSIGASKGAVSYTHLDVYKRQGSACDGRASAGGRRLGGGNGGADRVVLACRVRFRPGETRGGNWHYRCRGACRLR